jgi:hypothetical protein
MLRTPEDRTFYLLVQRAIFQVTPEQQGRFGLLLDDRAAPVFNGAREGEVGHIGASVCRDGARVRAMAMRARDGLAATLKDLPPSANEQTRKAGFYYSQETLADGAEFFYFPILVISHGALGPVTGVIYDTKTGRATVVQAEFLSMCEQFGRDFQDSAFCPDPRGALKRIAQALR